MRKIEPKCFSEKHLKNPVMIFLLFRFKAAYCNVSGAKLREGKQKPPAFLSA